MSSKVVGIGFDYAKLLAQYPTDNVGLNPLSDASADVLGAWLEVVANIGTEDIYLEFLTIHPSHDVLSRTQIGVGAGGSEIVICDMSSIMLLTIKQSRNYSLAKVLVKAGSRLAIRCSDSEAQIVTYTTWLHYSKR